MSNDYPPRIRLSRRADSYLTRLVDDLIIGHVELYQLPLCLADLYNLGHTNGIESLRPALYQANADADRYYAAAFNPRSAIKPGPSYAELERIRGNHEHADQIDADNRRRFGDAS
ncbi:hypothetical protein [Cryobacterium sp. Y50]|uniref:hypothetical protein n=1 Tax=Cryobacterium sp. Y50 TaxID=2048286 RepID=UPI000CE2E0ED|nr:hypothetical protein [Cryobacterium sp. Y50]